MYSHFHFELLAFSQQDPMTNSSKESWSSLQFFAGHLNFPSLGSNIAVVFAGSFLGAQSLQYLDPNFEAVWSVALIFFIFIREIFYSLFAFMALSSCPVSRYKASQDIHRWEWVVHFLFEILKIWIFLAGAGLFISRFARGKVFERLQKSWLVRRPCFFLWETPAALET